MQKHRDALWLWFTAAVAFVVAAVVFEPVWPLHLALAASDSSPHYAHAYKAQVFNNWINDQMFGFSHDALLSQLLPLLFYHDVSYMLAAALLALAVAVYLRGRRLPPLAAMAGGLAMAFSGYHFTLFNPGHRGYFIMMPYAVFLFALIDRAVVAPRWSQFALMAVCVAYAVGSQPDVLVLWLAVAGAYTLLRVAQTLRWLPAPVRRGRALRWLAGGGVGLLVLALAGESAIQRTFTVTLAMRDRQRGAATPSETASNPEAEAKARAQAWEFATNWSLPPEDMLEFIAPNVRGYDSGNPDGPYWGRLGQSLGWKPESQGFPNYRGHTVYLGALQLLFALFALCGAVFLRRRPADAAVPPDDAERDNRGIVLFWAATGVVALLLAFGRYTPLYQGFYALPMMSRFRAPVKFLHITELSVALLCAFGLARFLRAAVDGRTVRRHAVFCLGVAAATALACLVGALLLPAEGGALAQRWEGMGLGSVDARLRQLYVAALLRASALLAGGAVVFALAAFAPGAWRAGAVRVSVALVTLVFTLDMAETARHYVNPVDTRPLTARNPIADALSAQGPPDGVAVANRLAPLRSNHPLLWAFVRDGFAMADPPADATAEWPVAVSRIHFGQDARKQWLFWGTRAVLVPPQAVGQFTRDAEFAPMGTYAMAAGRLVAVPPASAQLAAVAFRPWVPTAAVFHRWRSVAKSDVWPTLAAPAFDLEREAVVEDGPVCGTTEAVAPTPAVLELPASRASYRRAVVRVNTATPGLLVLRERFDGMPNVSATVNGRRQPALQANGFFWAVPVGAGESTVVFAPALAWWRLALHGAGLLLALFALWRESRGAGSGLRRSTEVPGL